MMRKRNLPPIEICTLQKNVANWAEQVFVGRNKPENKNVPVFRLVAAIGELASSVFTEKTSKTYDPEEERARQRRCSGIILLFLIDFASRRGWNFEHVIREAWDFVQDDEWKPNPYHQHIPTTEEE